MIAKRPVKRLGALLILGISLLLAVAVCCSSRTASAGLVTVYYEGMLANDLRPTLPFNAGQRVHGTYTYDPSTPAAYGNDPLDTESSSYNDAIVDFQITLDGFGTGSAFAGAIWIGKPLLFTGALEFATDHYEPYAPATGITVPSSGGPVDLFAASIRLVDIDQNALASEALTAMPPALAPFQDHVTSVFRSDRTEILVGFQPSAGVPHFAFFQLTALRAVPEPRAAAMLVTCVLSGLSAARRRGVWRR